MINDCAPFNPMSLIFIDKLLFPLEGITTNLVVVGRIKHATIPLFDIAMEYGLLNLTNSKHIILLI